MTRVTHDRWLFAIAILATFAIVLLLPSLVHAHDTWSNGQPVPAWVKRYCCGPEDVHHLTPAQVTAGPNGWIIEGYPAPIPYGTEQVSQDGDYWAFWRVYPNGEVSPVFCFFAPPLGS